MIVRDNAGAPLPGVSVGWSVTAGGGSVSPTSRISDAGGIARTRHTLGPNAGPQTARATVTGRPPVDFSAISRINGAVTLGDRTIGPLSDTVLGTNDQPLVVMVTNESDAPVPGIIVTWAAGGGTVSQTLDTTDAGGESSVEYTFGGTAGNQTATATVTGLVGSPLQFTLNATAGTATQIAKTAGDGGTSAPSSQVVYTVQARDANGNPKNGVTIDWAVASGGGSITPAQNITGTNGNATATHTLGSGTGANTATATANALAGTPSVTFTTTAAIVTTVEVRQNSTFFPTNVTITAGNTVTWEWQGTTLLHNVTFAATAGAPADITDRTSGSIARTFNTAGTFNYQCTNHPATMNGTVTVNP